MTDAKRITSLSVAILLAAQLFTPFIPAAYADDKKGQNTTSIATSETAMQSSLEEDKEADINLKARTARLPISLLASMVTGQRWAVQQTCKDPNTWLAGNATI